MSEAGRMLKSKSSWICEYCDKNVFAPSLLELHRRAHTGERPFPCNLCDYSAPRKSHLQRHIRGHLQEKPFKCPELDCTYSSGDKASATRHHKIVHLREKRYECPISGCSHKAGQKADLTRHMTTHEENPEKPFKCELGPFKAKTKGDVKMHMTYVHLEVRNFKCPKSEEGCIFVGKTKSALTQHLQFHSEKSLACPHPNCEYKTNNKPRLNQHMKIHTSDLDSEKKYKCRICDYSSHRSSDLTSHMRTHTKETPYKCKIQGCQYQAKSASNLTVHVRSVHEKL